MTPSRVVRVILAFLLLSVVPSFASAATTEFRVLFDVDNDDTTGCTVNGMDGVDQVLVTQVTDDDSSARVTRTHREVCTGSVLGGPIDIVTDGWDAGWNDTTKLLTLETRIPFTAFGSEDMPSGIHVGFDGTRNGSVHTSLANQDGSPIIIARPPSRGRGRRAVGFGDDRHIELDGQLADWGRIKPAVIGLASNGSPSLRLLRILAWPDTGDDHFYFAATAYLGSDYPYADDNMYLRNPGESLSITAPGVLDNDGIPSGAPLTAEKVSDPARGTVTLNADGSFTYSPTHPQLLRDDEFEYKAIGDGKESNVARVIIQVDQNDGPNAPQDDAYTTAEDTAKIVPGPGVLENDPHTDLLVASLFSPPSHGTVVINADGGFTYTPSPHFSGTDSFVYTAAKKQGAPEGIGGNATVTITVTPVNDAPVIEPDTFTIPENSPNNTVVGTPDAFDIDGDTLSFSIVGGNTGGAFSINSSTGQIRVANSSALNFETTPTFSLTVRVEDADDSDEATITINLTDTNEPPVLTAGGTLVYTENDPPSVIDGALTVTDTDSAQLTGATVVISANFASGQDVLAFTPVGAITGVFAGNTLTLSGNDTPANYQLALRGVTYQNTSDNPSVAARTITWTASDGTFTSAPVTSTVNVIAVNDEPSFAILADPPASDEDAGPQTVNGFASSISYGPEESGQDPLTFVLTPTGTTGDLAFSAGPAIDAAGNLTYTASADTNGTATFDVVLTDSGSNTPPNDNTSATLSFTITVDPVNDAPSFVEGADVVALDTDGLTTVTGWATSLSEGPANESAQLLDLIVGNDSPALFTVAPAIAPDGTLTFTPAPGQDGIATVTVQIHDDGGTANGGVDTSAAQTMTITVEKIPTITSADNTTFTVGQAGTFTVTTTGRPKPDIAQGGTLPAGVTFVDGSGPTKGTGTLSGTPAALTGGVYPITFQATNTRGSSPIQNFTLTVNEAPGITSANTATFTQGAAGSFTITTIGFPDPAIGLTGTLPTGLSFGDNGDGTATISGTATAAGGSYSGFTLTASNGVGSDAVQNLTIVINEAPVITSANNTTFLAGTPANFTVTTTGFPAPALGITGTLPTGITFTDNGDGTATFGGNAVNGSGGVYVITITATNVAGSDPQSFTITVCNQIVVTNPANANGPADSPFSETFTETGAVGGATFTTASTLPTGMSLSTAGVLSGTPTQTGTFPIVVTVTDGNGCTGTSSTYNLVITCQTITVNNPANANGTAASPFSETFTETGAIGGATFTTASTLPAGMSLSTAGVLSGTPTQTGTFPIVVTVTDGNGCTGTSATYNLVIGCQTITVTNPANGNGTAASAFSETFSQTGGIGTTNFSLASGVLPAGLTLAANGTLSGVPTQTGSFPITVTATDSNGCTGTGGTYTIVIACQVINVTNPANTAGTVSAAFSETFTQTGAIGTATFTTASTLPAGLTLSAAGVLSGTPTEDGAFPIVVTVTDSNGCTGTSATYNLVIGCQTITVTNPVNTGGTVSTGFSETFTQTDAVGGSTFTLDSGVLPAGLTLATDGTLSGTPTEDGSFPITVLVTDGNGCTGVSPTYTLVIACQTITVINPANATGPADSPFSETFTETGAVGGATFTTASTLPAGMSLSTAGVLSGTPTQTGTFPIVVTVTDGNGCTGTSSTYNLVITCQTITVNNPANANGTAASPFSETFTETGAIGGATFTTASTLPAGMSLSTAGVLSGTPTQTGTFPIVVTVTDGNGCTGTSATYNLVVGCQTITVTNPANGNGTAASAFSETFSQTGGIGTTNFSLASGVLPAGLTLAANGVLSGTPTQTGSFPITVTATDSNGCTGTGGTYTIVIACQVINVTNPANTAGTVSAAFSETFTQTGAIGTATFTTASTLPAGLTLSAAGVLSGTPTEDGAFPIVVTVTDSNGCTGTSATYNLVIGCQTITVTNPVNTGGTVSTGFSETFTQTDAVGGSTFTLDSGVLPAGLTLATDGTLSGTPTEDGSFPITVLVTDGNGCTGVSPTYTLVIACQTITVINPANATGPADSPFSETFTETGAVGGATFTTASTLPAGMSLSTAGVLSGTPTQTGTFPIVVTVTDGNGCTGTSSTYNLVITCQTITVNNPANANGTADAAFSETFTETGAIGGATFTTVSTLPAGLTLSTAGVLSGTPTQTGNFAIVVTVTDGNGCTGTSATYNLVIACQTITVTNPANANGTAASPFSETFTQTGGIGATTFSLASGTLPAGLSLAANGVLSGTPTQTGNFPITVTATDSNGCTGTGLTYTIVIACQVINVTNPANTAGTVSAAFSETFTQTGAIGTATFTTASTLPAGLTLSAAGVLSGTPTEDGAFPIVVTVTDSNGCTGTSATYNLVIGCQTITVTNPVNTGGTVSAGFSETFTQTDAVGGSTFTLDSGVLPAGLTLATDGTLSGTPTEDGSFPITVLVTDGNGCTGTSPTYNLVIACQTITVTNPANATGPAGSPFSETFTETGAVGGATFTTVSTLPAGLSLSTAGVLSGTPTEDGAFPIVVTVTDGNGCTGTSSTYNLTITCPTITVTNPGNSTGTSGVAFSETFTQSGGIGTITWSLGSGVLPAGITLNSATGELAGTTNDAGVFPITVTATDQNGCDATGATYNLTINCQTIAVTNPGVNTGTVDAAFSETFTQTGVLGTVTWSVESGTLPAGITLNPTTGVLSGTPTEDGSFPVTIRATDSNNCFDDSAYTLTINCQTITVTNPGVNTGTVDAPFSQQFTETGAHATAAFTTSSALPAGLTLQTDGTLSGTPTEDGVFNIDVLVTDANGCTGTNTTYTLTINCQTITVTNPGVNTGTVGTMFSQTFTQSGAHATATFTTSSALPAGLSLSTAGLLSGTPTQFGVFAIDVLVTDANGCTGTNTTYNLTINCQTITVTNPGVNTGTVSAMFSQQFTQTGALGGATFTTSSTLPAGLTLAADGTLSGTPTEDGVFNIDVLVTDGNSCTGTGSTYTLTINCQTITVTNPVVTTGTAGTVFSQMFTQTDAVGAVAFTTSSTLPAGLMLQADGTLTGTPTEVGNFDIVVTVTDANGCTGTGPTYSLTIACQTITVTNPATTSIQSGQTLGAAFTFTATGILGTANWTLETGPLPAGVTLNATSGQLEGSSTVQGSYPITVRVTDTNGCFDISDTYTLDVVCPVITVARTGGGAFPAGTFNVAYPGESFAGSGGTAPYTFAVTSGTFPTGLTLNNDGTITGTPTATGTFNFTVTATDASACPGSQAFSIAIAPDANDESYSNLVNNTQALVTGGTTSSPTTPFVALTGTLTANDLPAAGVTAVAGTFATTQGGSVTIAADGTYIYTPPVTVNALATDTFTYTISSNTGSTGTPTMATGTATLNLAGRVWYVRNDVANGDGRSHSPFNSTSNFNNGARVGPDKPADIIFVYKGDLTTANQDTGVVLLDNEQLIGHGVALIVNGHTLVGADTKPLLTHTAGAAITLGNGNTVKGLTATGANTSGIFGSGKAGFTGDVLTLQGNTTSGLFLGSMTGTVTLTNTAFSGNGNGLVVDAGTATISVDNTNTIGTSTTYAVSVANRPVAAGDVTIGATINDARIQVNNNLSGTIAFTGTQTLNSTTAQAVTLATNAGATVNFSGTLGITSTTGTGFGATGGGTLNVLGTANLTTGAAVAGLSLNGMTVGGSGVTFNSVSTTGATTGIALTSVVGTVTVNGGTITNGTTGASLAGASTNLTLNGVTITGPTTGISGATFGTLTVGGGTSVSGTTALSLTSGTLNGTFASVTATGGTNGIALTTMTGTVTMSAGTLSGATGDEFLITGNVPSINVTYQGNLTYGGAASAINVTATTGVYSGNVTFSTGAINVTGGTGVTVGPSTGTHNYMVGSGTFGVNGAAAGINLGVNANGAYNFGTGWSITNTTGVPFTSSNNAGDATYSGAISQANNTALVSSTNLNSGGFITFQTGTVSATNGTGIQLVNADGPVSFNGTTTLNGGDAAIDILPGTDAVQGSAGAITFGANASITNPSGSVIDIQGSRPNFTYSGTFTKNTATTGINIVNNKAGLVVTINGVSTPKTLSTTTADGILISGNATPSITFSGGNLSVTTTTGNAVDASGGGTLTFSGANNDLTSGATVLLLNGMALGVGDLDQVTSTGGANGISLTNCTGGTLAIAGGSLTGNTGHAFFVSGGSTSVSYAGPITQNTATFRPVNITGITGGTITLSGAIGSTGGAGVSAAGTGGTVTITGQLTLSGASSVFSATGAGLVVNAPHAGNVVGSPTAATTTAVTIDNADVGASGVNFRTVNVNGGANGIVLNATGNTGGIFSVTGTGTTDGTGGTLQNLSGRGASFINANNISLKNMNITNVATAVGAPCGSAAVAGANTGCNAAVHMNVVTTVTLDNLNLTTSGQQGINGIDVTGMTLSNGVLSGLGNAADEDGLHFHNLLGTNSITSTSITSSGDDNVNIQNLSSTASTINITNGTFNTAVLGSGVLFGVRNTANTTINISGTTSNNNFSGGIVADGFDTSTMKIDVTTSTITNNNDGISLSCNNGSVQYDIHGNSNISGNDFVPINLLKAAFSVSGTLEGQIQGNTITVANGRPTDAMVVFQAGGGVLKSLITQNTINYAGTQRAILLQAGQDGNGSVEATITDNDIDIQLDGAGNAVTGILAQSAITGPGVTTAVCVDIGGGGAASNTFTHSLGGAMAGGDIRVRQRNDGTMRLPGYGGAATDTAAVITYLTGRNTVVSAPTATADSSGFAGGAACSAPTIP